MINILLASYMLIVVIASVPIAILWRSRLNRAYKPNHNAKVITPTDCREKYGNHRLPDFVRKSIVKRLNEYMHDQRPWLQDGLTLSSLASSLDVDPHYLSQVINVEYRKSFIGFINEHRVFAACHLLRVGDDKSMLRVAMESGFASKSSFNRIFKKCVGVTPTEYRRKYRSKEKRLLRSVS